MFNKENRVENLQRRETWGGGGVDVGEGDGMVCGQREILSAFLMFLWYFFNCDVALKIIVEFEIIIINF